MVDYGGSSQRFHAERDLELLHVLAQGGVGAGAAFGLGGVDLLVQGRHQPPDQPAVEHAHRLHQPEEAQRVEGEVPLHQLLQRALAHPPTPRPNSINRTFQRNSSRSNWLLTSRRDRGRREPCAGTRWRCACRWSPRGPAPVPALAAESPGRSRLSSRAWHTAIWATAESANRFHFGTHYLSSVYMVNIAIPALGRAKTWPSFAPARWWQCAAAASRGRTAPATRSPAPPPDRSNISVSKQRSSVFLSTAEAIRKRKHLLAFGSSWRRV